MILLLSLAADTVLVRQMPPVRSDFEQAVFVAAGLAQIVTLVVVVLLAVIFYRMWKAQQAMQTQLALLSSKVDPMIASATSAAENVRVLTDAVRKDAVAAAEALTEATGRVRDSVGGIADRIDEFGALMGRVTEKAEAVADLAGAAMTTFKAGKKLFRDKPEQRPRPYEVPRVKRPAPAPVDIDDELDEPLRLDEDEGPESPYSDEAHDRGAEGEGAPPGAPRRKRRKRRRRGGPSSGGTGSDGSSGGPPVG